METCRQVGRAVGSRALREVNTAAGDHAAPSAATNRTIKQADKW